MKRRLALITAVLVSSAAVAGCARHFEITDPTSGRTYYAKKYKTERRSGVVTFRDARTGNRVRLQTAEIENLAKREYRDAIRSGG